jgi:hypothetical protein
VHICIHEGGGTRRIACHPSSLTGQTKIWERSMMCHHAVQPRCDKVTGFCWTLGVLKRMFTNEQASWDI